MEYDADVLVIGGGINGLTAAAYLAKAGARVMVLEARSECGAHCNTEEVVRGGFQHNLHATWLITALSPAMEDLELVQHGLELVMCDYAYGKSFLNGKNALMGVNPQDTYANWVKLSPRDADLFMKVSEVVLAHWPEILDWVHTFIFTPPKHSQIEKQLKFMREMTKALGIEVPPEDLVQMNGFQALDLFFESEEIKTMLASFSWIGAFPPIHRRIGSAGCLGMAALAGPVFPVHQAKGGSHSLTHTLVRCCKAHGVKILTNAPVGEILLDPQGSTALGVKLARESVFPGETLTARKIISDLSFGYTFSLLDLSRVDPEMRARIPLFSYDEQVIFGIHYALSDAPVFSSAQFDPGIQRCFMGYIGGETQEEMKRFAVELVSGVVPEQIMANFFVPTLADPSQAPDHQHTAFLWLDVPPLPVRFLGEKVPYRFSLWDEVKWRLAERLTALWEEYAPGFRNLILDMFPYSPLDVWRNNPSAIRGNWCGGSVIPEQFFTLRPFPGVIVSGASRTFLKNLYLSNSIHPYGATWLASGYICAGEVAEDLGISPPSWWSSRAATWYIQNLQHFPRNLGVPARFRAS